MVHLKIIALNLGLFYAVSFSTAQEKNSISKHIEEFASYWAFENASISIQFKESGENGKVVGKYQAKKSILPASTMKLFSTATALEVLGAEKKFGTEISHSGTIDSGILNGDLWIIGNGDLTLGSYYFDDNPQAFLDLWVKKIKDAGIQKINGRIIVDGSNFFYNGVPDGWSWSDMGNYYGAGFSGINLYDNTVRYHFRTKAPGSNSTLTHTEPVVENLSFQNYIEAAPVRGDNSYIYGAPFSLQRFGTGQLPAWKPNFVVKGSMPDPELQLAQELKNVLQKHKISVKEALGNRSHRFKQPALTPIFTHEGKSVVEIIEKTNHRSINLFAEGMLCLAGKNLGSDGGTDDSADRIRSYWEGKIPTRGLYIQDGSGLARSNGVAASHFCELLAYMKQSENFESFYSSLPISGETGTIKNLCRNQVAHGKIHAKSGTMSRVKSYAGYLETNSGKELVFAIIVNNYNCSTSATKEQIEVLLNRVVE